VCLLLLLLLGWSLVEGGVGTGRVQAGWIGGGGNAGDEVFGSRACRLDCLCTQLESVFELRGYATETLTEEEDDVARVFAFLVGGRGFWVLALGDGLEVSNRAVECREVLLDLSCR